MTDTLDDYTLEDAEVVGILRRVADDVEAIQNAENEGVLEFLIEDEKLDVIHDGERGWDGSDVLCSNPLWPQTASSAS